MAISIKTRWSPRKKLVILETERVTKLGIQVAGATEDADFLFKIFFFNEMKKLNS